MKILILDDMEQRHEGFIKIFKNNKDAQLTHAWTYREAVLALRKEKFDMACLDHDLADLIGEEIKVESEHFNVKFSPTFINDGMYDSSRIFLDGGDVALWLRDHPQHCPPTILIHSWNDVGALQMQRIINEIPNIKVIVKPFKAP